MQPIGLVFSLGPLVRDVIGAPFTFDERSLHILIQATNKNIVKDRTQWYWRPPPHLGIYADSPIWVCIQTASVLPHDVLQGYLKC